MKIWNYVFIAMTMIIFFQFVGIPTAYNGILGFAQINFNNDSSLNSTRIAFSNFSNYLFGTGSSDSDSSGSGVGWLSILIGGGIALGLYASGKPDIAIKAGLATTIFVAFLPTLYFALTYALSHHVAAWAVGILAIIFIPFTIGFIIALFEYVIGGNTD